MLIVAFQFLVSLFTGSPNQRLIPFSKEITQYIYAVLLYLSYNSDEKPFPLSDISNNASSLENLKRIEISVASACRRILVMEP